MSESDVCYIISFAKRLLLLLKAGRRLSPKRLILREEGIVSMLTTAFDDDLIAANIDSDGTLTP